MADPYATLGVSRDADEKTIKSAYRTLAKELHPDRNKDNPAAADRFGKVTQAYDLLMDKDKRAAFDRGEIDEEGNPRGPFGYGGGGGGGFRGQGGPQGGFGGFSGGPYQGGGEEVDLGDLFSDLFGGGGGRQQRSNPFGRGGRAAPPKGANIAYRMQVSFTDAATREPQRITLADGKTIDLKLPAGLVDGQQIRLAGKGQQGPGGTGDGIVTVQIGGHPFYERDGDTIRLDLPITLKEAVLGGKVRVPTVDGPVMLTVPAGSSSGKTLRLKGRGFSTKSGGRGDQLVRLMVELPEDDAALKQFVEGWEAPGGVRDELGV
ncbi:DnaJ C-terminal domain-containing protein [Novosphingopyxis sp. YJ-S2-01]|uniref:DnaJ C-terminal domain-containing protein n=1 Tax=Novosphingopyxis sp. YJ-S2-01 TaxID=2794021 RepID=UPI0018DC0E78|nr:J domain-containing protein [Novosphingopyxis sp. YJ-S2-01]MBH9536122.1 J domain-containing protein [Novosphingopyxis sp. YJ-S2-01]